MGVRQAKLGRMQALLLQVGASRDGSAAPAAPASLVDALQRAVADAGVAGGQVGVQPCTEGGLTCPQVLPPACRREGRDSPLRGQEGQAPAAPAPAARTHARIGAAGKAQPAPSPPAHLPATFQCPAQQQQKKQSYQAAHATHSFCTVCLHASAPIHHWVDAWQACAPVAGPCP